MNFLIGLLSMSILFCVLYLLGIIPYNLIIIKKKEYPKGEYCYRPILNILITGILTAISLIGVFFLVMLFIQIGDAIIDVFNTYINLKV